MQLALPLLALALITPALAAPLPPNLGKLAEVKAGLVKSSTASWWGFDPADSTAQLQAAIDSGVAKLTIDNVGQPWVVEPLKLASHQEIVFAAGVIVEAKPGSFLGGNDSLFTAAETEDVILRGEGDDVILRMRKADYDDPTRYKKAEWRHTLNLRSVNGFQAINLTLASSGGDGIYFGVAPSGLPCRNVVIRDVICDDHYRQGISVISAENVLCERVVMKNTGGTNPKAGIDFEPNHPTEKLANFVMRDCIAEDNEGAAYVFYIPNLNATSDPVSVTLENCIARGSHPQTFTVITGNGEGLAVGGFIKAVGCRFEGGNSSAVSITNTPPSALKVILEDTAIVNPCPDKPATSPIQISARRGALESAGNLDLKDVLIIDPVERKPLSYQSWSIGVGLGTVTGNLILERNGQRTNIALTPEQIEAWVPAVKAQQVPSYAMAGRRFGPAGQPGELTPPTNRIRNATDYRLHAMLGQSVKVTIRSHQVSTYTGDAVKITVRTSAGQPVAQASVPFKEAGELTFTAPTTDTYRITIDPDRNVAQVTAASHPLVLTSESAPIHFFTTSPELFFLVPANTPSFGITVMGEGGGEAVKATVSDAQGQVAWTEDNIAEPRVYVHQGAAAKDEVWRIKLEKPSALTMEDYYLVLHGIPPFVAGSAAGLLRAE